VDQEEPHGALVGLPGVLDVTVEADGLRQHLAFSAEATSATDLIAAVAAQTAVRDLQVVEPSIEDVVRTLYTT
jgi:ABC-2 type transport system ATP-binding protein